MNARTRTLVRKIPLGWLLGGTVIGLLSCAPELVTDPAKVDPDATAGCETASPALQITNENMLPGRICGNCHKAGGPAERSPFTISGTVFDAPNSGCNNGGRRNVIVEVRYATKVSPQGDVEEAGDIQPMGIIKANAVGNFRSAARFTTPMAITVYDANDPDCSPDTKNEMCGQKMFRALGREVDAEVNCAACHQFPGIKKAPGRIYLDP